VKFGRLFIQPPLFPSASIAEGVMILHGSVIQADTIIGKHVLVNTAASIDHENVIGDYAHVSMPRARVHVGTQVGAVVLPNLKLANGVRLVRVLW
jgi:UDP-3-O-[3-hydroxymyristoyl] glucosamine N-acyltransferase